MVFEGTGHQNSLNPFTLTSLEASTTPYSILLPSFLISRHHHQHSQQGYVSGVPLFLSRTNPYVPLSHKQNHVIIFTHNRHRHCNHHCGQHDSKLGPTPPPPTTTTTTIHTTHTNHTTTTTTHTNNNNITRKHQRNIPPSSLTASQSHTHNQKHEHNYENNSRR